MARETVDQPITTRNARKGLAPRREPYWRAVDAGVALGYRRGSSGGFWSARLRLDGAKGYRVGAIGQADDTQTADNAGLLDFRQAVERAKAWAARERRVAAGLEPAADQTPYTIERAFADYLADYGRRGGRNARDIEWVARSRILPDLGSIRVDALTASAIKRWHQTVATSPPRLRSKAGSAELRTRVVPEGDTEAQRARRATANRVLTILKATLNYAYREGKAPSDDAWRRVKPFPKADAPRIRYLTETEATRLVEACSEDFGRLVSAALLTGCRYGELTTLRVAGIDLIAGAAAVSGKSGARNVALTDAAATLLRPLVEGVAHDALVLRRADGAAWGKSHQFRPLREACAAAKIEPAVSFHILRHCHASWLATRGVPLPVISAQLGHADGRITSRHYAHLAPSHVADVVRAAFRGAMTNANDTE